MCVRRLSRSGFRETASQLGAEPNGDVDNNSSAATTTTTTTGGVEFKPKTEPASPQSHHQCVQQPQQRGPANEAGELRHVTSSHLLAAANHQPTLPPHLYQPHHLSHHHHHQHGYGSCSMGFDPAAVEFAAAAAQCAGRPFTSPTSSPFDFSPATAHHRIAACAYYDAVKPTGFDGM